MPDFELYHTDLDSVVLQQSPKHPAMVTITVEDRRSVVSSSSASPQEDRSQWHLPAPDPRNEGKYVFKIHTLDIYFWKAEDATLFIDSAKRILSEHQIQISGASPSSSHYEHHRDTMSPVVQKLESLAVTKPYQGHRSDSMSTNKSFTGPPTRTMQGGAGSPEPIAEAPPSYAPLAYNPAAPSAPEPIAHREKTPPPDDGEGGTGLAAAAQYDYGNPMVVPPLQQHPAFRHQQSPPQQTSYFPGPPQWQMSAQSFPPPSPMAASLPSVLQRTNTSGSFPPPPPQQPGSPQGQQYAQSYASPPQDPNAHLYGQASPPLPPQLHQRQSSYSTPAQYGAYPQQQFAQQPQQQYVIYPSSPGHVFLQSTGPPTPGYAPPPSGYTTVPSAPAPMRAPALHSHDLPPGGYSTYSYQQQPQPQSQAEAYAVHQQVYRPTEGEAGHGKPVAAGPGQQPGKLEQRAAKVEKGVGRFLKKLDQRF
ncbi:hypothetical protein LTR39_002149 [Cryomyces antarcticus]|nr:hypothetical protein LTR39_002149 [Cryomyces antarcticus]